MPGRAGPAVSCRTRSPCRVPLERPCRAGRALSARAAGPGWAVPCRALPGRAGPGLGRASRTGLRRAEPSESSIEASHAERVMLVRIEHALAVRLQSSSQLARRLLSLSAVRFAPPAAPPIWLTPDAPVSLRHSLVRVSLAGVVSQPRVRRSARVHVSAPGAQGKTPAHSARPGSTSRDSGPTGHARRPQTGPGVHGSRLGGHEFRHAGRAPRTDVLRNSGEPACPAVSHS
jgi:hypothetical protein